MAQPWADDGEPQLVSVIAINGAVTHVRVTDEVTPGIRCRHDKREIALPRPRLALKSIQGAVPMGKRCCGICWGLLSAESRAWPETHAASFASRKAGACKSRRVVK